MTIKEALDQDLKKALLAGQKSDVSVLRGLKSAILYEEVASNKREKGLPDDQVVLVVRRELKKRIEAAELYAKGSAQDKADTELYEAEIIRRYLPPEPSDLEIKEALDALVGSTKPERSQMGELIGRLKQQFPTADASKIAQLVKGAIEA